MQPSTFTSEQFANPSLNHIEIRDNFELTLSYNEKGHEALGEVVFRCTHNGEISKHDEQQINHVLSEAFQAAAYVPSNVNITTFFNGEESIRKTIFRSRWGGHRSSWHYSSAFP